MIKIENLQIAYDQLKVVENSSFVANRGEITVIYGKSGCGKSSLLQVISLLLKMPCSSFVIDGIDIKKNPKKAEDIRKFKIGYIFQENNLHDQMTILDNIKLYTLISNVPFDIEKVKNVLEMVHLNLPLQQKVCEMSGGEKQRLAIACALIKDPDIIVADEPSSGLDYKNEQIIIELFEKLAHEYHKCIIIASHSNEVKRHGDNLCTIENQTIIQNNKNIVLTTSKTKDKKMDPKFYMFYLLKSSLLNKKIYLPLGLIMSVIIVTIMISQNIESGLITRSEMDLEKNSKNDIELYCKDSFNQNDLDYFSESIGVRECNFFYEVQSENYQLQPIFSYQDSMQLNEHEVMISKRLAEDMHLQVGDIINIVELDKDMTIKKILTSNPSNFSDVEFPFVYMNSDLFQRIQDPFVSSDHFVPIRHRYILIRAESFSHIPVIMEDAINYEKEIQVFTGSKSYVILNQMKQNIIHYVHLFCKIILIIFVVFSTLLQFVDLKNHQYEYALLKANGLTNLELSILMLGRALVEWIFLTGLSTILLVLMNYIFFKLGYMAIFEPLKGLFMLVEYNTLILALPTMITLYINRKISAGILLKG